MEDLVSKTHLGTHPHQIGVGGATGGFPPHASFLRPWPPTYSLTYTGLFLKPLALLAQWTPTGRGDTVCLKVLGLSGHLGVLIPVLTICHPQVSLWDPLRSWGTYSPHPFFVP